MNSKKEAEDHGKHFIFSQAVSHLSLSLLLSHISLLRSH